MADCSFCKKGAMEPATTTYMVDLKECIVIIRNVPCEECPLCGEKVFADSVMRKLEDIIEKVRSVATEVFVTDYAKVAA